MIASTWEDRDLPVLAAAVEMCDENDQGTALLAELSSRLVTALDRAADEEPDEEKKSWLRKTAGYLGSAGKDVTVEVAAAVVNRQIGGA